MRPLTVCYKLDRSVKLSWLHKLTWQHVELTSVCEIKMTHFFISCTAGGIRKVIFQNRLKCIHNHIFSCLLGLNSLCKLFLFLEMCLSEYHCWEIIMLWMGAVPLCSAACFILAVFLRLLDPRHTRALIWITQPSLFQPLPHFLPPFFSPYNQTQSILSSS